MTRLWGDDQGSDSPAGQDFSPCHTLGPTQPHSNKCWCYEYVELNLHSTNVCTTWSIKVGEYTKLSALVLKFINIQNFFIYFFIGGCLLFNSMSKNVKIILKNYKNCLMPFMLVSFDLEIRAASQNTKFTFQEHEFLSLLDKFSLK